jgi:hypothetical protein
MGERAGSGSCGRGARGSGSVVVMMMGVWGFSWARPNPDWPTSQHPRVGWGLVDVTHVCGVEHVLPSFLQPLACYTYGAGCLEMSLTCGSAPSRLVWLALGVERWCTMRGSFSPTKHNDAA